MGSTAFCTSCARTLYLEEGASAVCPVCSSPVLLTSVPAERAARIGKNEAMYRDVNERIDRIARTEGRYDMGDPPGFVCECGSDTCTETIHMGRTDYDDVRRRRSTFAVIPGHELPDVETVIERREGYYIVEKHGQAARSAE